MKSIEKKTTLHMFLALLVMIFIILGFLIRLDCASAQGSGQGGQTLGYGGLGAGAMIGFSGLNMIGSGLGMAGFGASAMASPFSLGLPMSGSGSIGMLGIGSGILGGGSMLGFGFGTPYNMLSSLVYTSGGFGPYFGQVMPMTGVGYMNTVMPPIMPFSPFYDTGLPTGYSGYYATAYGNELLRRFSNSTGITGVPYFSSYAGVTVPPLPYWVDTMQLFQQPSILPSEVKGYVLDEQGEFLEGVEVTLIYSSTQKSYTTKTDGLYMFSLFAGTYTLGFKISGYEDQTKIVRVLGGREEWVEEVTMEPINHAPRLKDMLPIEVPSGEEINLEPYVYADDPDGDQLSFSYSGWKAEYWNTQTSYITTDDDIGVHEVKVRVTEVTDELLSDEKTVTIIVSPGYEISLYVGFNLISYPFEEGFTASVLLAELGGNSKIYSIGYYDNSTDKYIWYYSNGNLNSIDFAIEIGKGYVIYAHENIEEIVFNRYTGEKQSLILYEGMNLIGIASYPEGYTSYDLLKDLGYDYVESIYRFDSFRADWESTYWLNGSPAGVDFPILMGEGYKIQMKMQYNYSFPRLRSFTF